MRLFRTLIALGAAGLFLPSPPDDGTATQGAVDQPSTLEVLFSAGSAASDAWSFCSRQPEVCSVAGYLAGRLEAKALYSASLLWGWAWDGHDVKPVAAAKGPFTAITVGGERPAANGTDSKGQSTLGLDDLLPPWRGPSQDG